MGKAEVFLRRPINADTLYGKNKVMEYISLLNKLTFVIDMIVAH